MRVQIENRCRVLREHFGIVPEPGQYVIALAGNPNVGKSTIFNALTGLRQHTGNWPGKTVDNAQGSFTYGKKSYLLVEPARHIFDNGSHDRGTDCP